MFIFVEVAFANLLIPLKMKHLLVLPVSFICLLSVFVTTAGMASETASGFEKPGSFRSIEIEGGHEVIFTQGKTDIAALTYEVTPGFEHYSEVYADGDKLIIRWKDGADHGDARITAYVSSPLLENVTITGDGKFTVDGKFTAFSLKATINGAGVFRAAKMKCDFFDSEIHGGGYIGIGKIKAMSVKSRVWEGGETFVGGRTEMGDFQVYGNHGGISYDGLKINSLNYRRNRPE